MAGSGELAAVGTALCWGTSTSLFVTAGRRMGAVLLNRLRLTVAAVLLASTLWIVHGSPWPMAANRTQLGLLAISGLLGFVAGDSLYFKSLIILGGGKAALLMAMTPIFTAFLAQFFLHEPLGPRAWLGIVVVLSGLVTVLYGRAPATSGNSDSKLRGVVYGLTAAFLSSIGFILSKTVLHQGLDALSATTVRIGAAVPALWLLAPIMGGSRTRTLAALRDGEATRAMLGAAVLGPYLGVTSALFALQHAETAVATSIFSCYPLLAIFLGARFQREPVTSRTVAGALLTVGGVVILFMR
jgi:drug/metabolite transporter (DMT)-like permease